MGEDMVIGRVQIIFIFIFGKSYIGNYFYFILFYFLSFIFLGKILLRIIFIFGIVLVESHFTYK